MNAQTDNRSRKDGIVAVIGLLVFLLGMATGNALVMLVVCTVGLVGMLIFDRQRWGRSTWLIMMVGAAIAAVTAIAISILG
jgi:hypothetical protein